MSIPLILGHLIRGGQLLWNSKAFLVRALICWLLGLAVLLNERGDDFDSRFKMRGNALKSDDITLILISEDEWMNLRGHGFQTLRPLKEIESISDGFFSDLNVWDQLLGQLLKLNPKAIGVSVFVGDTGTNYQSLSSRTVAHPKVVWSARLDSDGQLLRPRVLPLDDRHLGLVDYKPDSDGLVRRFSPSNMPLPNMALRLAKYKDLEVKFPKKENLFLNYQGPASTFLSFTLTELLFGTLPESAIKDKIVVIGTRGTYAQTILTPVGPMTKAEIVATTTNNLLHSQWISSLPNWVYALLLLGLLAISIWIVTQYSQYIALLFLVAVWALFAAGSIWAFDSKAIWIPIVAPSVQMAITFVVFLSFQLVMNEQENWKLQQEKRYLEEIEEIKNNFLSLVSHDLKTPIAKIQAVAERLMAHSKDEGLLADLKTVKSSSQDLHRYIQSLLQVIRVESTDFHARKTPADINELLTKVVEELLPLAREKSISIHLDLEPMFSIELDTTLIYEVALNLIENAIKYTPQGGSVTVSSKETESDVVVSVKDTGEGIPTDEIQKVWNKFYRGRKHDTSTKGSGLGLYLSKYFIQLHGGDVFLESQPEKGTLVGFRLPLNEPEA